MTPNFEISLSSIRAYELELIFPDKMAPSW